MRRISTSARLAALAGLALLGLVALCEPIGARQPHVPVGRQLITGLTVVQQTTDYTCGPAAAVGLARFYGKPGEELAAAKVMRTSTKKGTTPWNMARWLKLQGLKVKWGEHGTVDMLRRNVAAGIPTLVEWIDWGGHWVVVVGIDDRGTATTDDDEIILADPYDRIDGTPDGLTIVNLDRFVSMWFDAFLFGRPMRRVYIYVEPAVQGTKRPS
jgi:hypothetical protein